MGKKGSWFSALKKAFTSSSKDKSSEKRKEREKSRKSNHGEANSFIPLYREPSSIEKILGDAEREQHHKIQGDAEGEQQCKVSMLLGEREQHHKLQEVPPKKVPRLKTTASKPVVTRNRAQISAIKIQAAYRGYMARRSYRALKGLVRLQGVMRGQSVKRQTMNTMRCMQLLVRVQSQIRARRMQMMEGRGLQQHKTDKEAESSLSKWSLTHRSEAEAHEEWEDSVLTKEEIDERMQRKVEAVIKRERALAYAYSHQLLKVTPKSAQAVMTDIRSGGYPWWWNWLERQLPPQPEPVSRTRMPSTPKPAATAPSFRPGSSRSKLAQSTHDHLDSSTPRSSKLLRSPRAKHPTHPLQRWQQPHSKLAANVSLIRDDESLTSCPAFTVPRYMAPTASANAKMRSHGVDEDGTGCEGKRRFAFGFGTSIGSVRWGKVGGSLFAGKDSGPPQRTPTARHKSTRSIGGLSVDSTVSLPVGVGRKPFR